MYCPNCAATAKTDQKFCRSCGMELHAVAQLVDAQTDIKKPEPAKALFSARQRAMVIWGLILTLAAVFIGSSVKLLGKENIQVAGDFTPYLMVLNLLLVFLGMGLMCYPFLQMMSPNRRSSLPPSPKSQPTVGLKPTLLPEEPPSIVEKTTEFLEAAAIPRDALDTAPHEE